MRFTKRTRIFAIILIITALACSAALAHAAARGRLMPFSPIVLGFQHRDSARARIYFHEGAASPAELDSLVRNADGLLAEVESAHGLHFQERAEIFLCSSDIEHKRLSGTGARFRVLPLYGRLFVSKRAQDDAAAGAIHFDTYLKHELSHSLLFQNMSLWHALHCPDWLLEGLAVSTSRQMGVDGYFTPGQVRDTIRQGYFLHPDDFVQKPWKSPKVLQAFPLPDKYLFLYPEMACLVEDLIRVRGIDTFHLFLQGVLAGTPAEAHFQAIYATPFNTYVDQFRARMLSGEQSPASGAPALGAPAPGVPDPGTPAP